MIEANLYRCRIGLFNNVGRKPKYKLTKCGVGQKSFNLKGYIVTFAVLQTLLWLLIFSSSLPGPGSSVQCRRNRNQEWSSSTQPLLLFRKRGKHESVNFKAKILHGNIKRGIKNMHVNIRSIYNKMTEVKQLVHSEKPHILGISEAELRKNSHSLDRLKVPGYNLLLPKTWNIIGKARIVVYVKKTLEF